MPSCYYLVDSPFPFHIRSSPTGIVLIQDLANTVWTIINKNGKSLTDGDISGIVNDKPTLFDLPSKYTLKPSTIKF